MTRSTTRRVNMRQIASRAGVSPSTVSVVLNQSDGVPVAGATRSKVLRIARDLGYQRSFLVRAIKNPLRHVGIATGDLQLAQETFTGPLFQGVHQQLAKHGYQVMLHCVGRYRSETNEDVESVPAKVIELCRSRLVDGIVLDKQHFLDKEVLRLAAAGVPMVTVNGGRVLEDARGRLIASAGIDDQRAAELLAEHLLSLGHRRIGLLSRPYRLGPRAFHSEPVRLFNEGCQRALARGGATLSPGDVVEGDMLDAAVTADAVVQLMRRPAPPTALLVGDDLLAIMAINTLRRMGKSVPDDVSVTGYGDLAVARRLADPPLTTVHAPLLENGRAAAAMLIRLLTQGPLPSPTLALTPRLLVRQSTAPAKTGRGRKPL